MDKNVSLAVSGAAGSFSEEAGLLYAQRIGKEADMTFSLDMHGVLTDVSEQKVTTGIFPVVNSRGGLVRSAFEAMGEFRFRVIDEVWFEVFQCIMVQPGTNKEQITQIVSHPQALAQCERYLRREFPEVRLVEWQDTAKAAKDLSEGTLDQATTAVIAPSRSAQIYQLHLLDRGIQDNHPNVTTFIVVEAYD